MRSRFVDWRMSFRKTGVHFSGTCANVLAAATLAVVVAFGAWLSVAALILASPTRRRAEAAPRGTPSRRGREPGPSGAPDMRARTFRPAARTPQPRFGQVGLPPDRARSTKAA